MQNRIVYDISVSLGDESIDYPGDTPYCRELIWTIKDSGICDLAKLVMSAHSGTHIDAPTHFIEGDGSLDAYRAKDFILPTRVVEVQDREAVKVDELKNHDLETGESILFKTNNSTSGISTNGVFSEKYVYLTPDAAQYCVNLNCKLVGIDYISIEKYGDSSFPAHRKLLQNGILVLEGLNLREVPPGRYTLLCLPLKIKGGEASPVRAVLLG